MLRPLFFLGAVALIAHGAEPAPNTLTPEEAKAGWRLLWDGHTAAGWRSARSDVFPAKGWLMNDGVLTVVASGRDGGLGGDIVTREKFSDFELSADFKLTPDVNSGIKYFVVTDSKGALGLEYQIIDNLLNSDAKAGKNGNRALASLYDLFPPTVTQEPRPMGEWNTARIVSRGAHVEHWLNGEKVLEFTRFTPEFRAAVQGSKYKANPGFGELHEGHILLQDHGHEVFFRNLKLRVLPAP